MWQTEIGNYGSFFAFLTLPPPTPHPTLPKNPENQKFEKKNCWRYHHFTHVYQKPQLYEMWFLRYRVRQTEFFVILGYFLPFTLLTTLKIKILKKWKNHMELSSFYTCLLKMTIIWCMVPETWSVTDRMCSHFGPFFAFLAHCWPWKLKFGKKSKNTWRYHQFTHVYQKLWSDDVWFLRYGVRRTDRWTDKWKKWHIEVRAPPRKMK